jgi:hypothetical protein
MRTRLGIALLVFLMMHAVVFGVGALLVLATPLNHSATALMPLVVLLSAIFAAALSWWLAPRLRARYWRDRPEQQNAADKILSSLS